MDLSIVMNDDDELLLQTVAFQAVYVNKSF